MSFRYTILVITPFFMHNFLSGSEDTRIYPGQEKYTSFFSLSNKQNSSIGELDLLLFRQYLSNKFNNMATKDALFTIHDQIRQSHAVIHNGKITCFQPFFVSFFDENTLKQLASFFNTTSFPSQNKSNREFSKQHPEAIPIDHCSYALKANGLPIGIICCFFNREIILTSFMKYIREMPIQPSPTLPNYVAYQ